MEFVEFWWNANGINNETNGINWVERRLGWRAMVEWSPFFSRREKEMERMKPSWRREEQANQTIERSEIGWFVWLAGGQLHAEQRKAKAMTRHLNEREWWVMAAGPLRSRTPFHSFLKKNFIPPALLSSFLLLSLGAELWWRNGWEREWSWMKEERREELNESI